VRTLDPKRDLRTPIALWRHAETGLLPERPEPVPMLIAGFDDLYSDELRGMLDHTAMTGQSLYSPELVPPASGDSYNRIVKRFRWWLYPDGVNTALRRETGVSKRAAAAQEVFERDRLERQRQKNIEADRQWAEATEKLAARKREQQAAAEARSLERAAEAEQWRATYHSPEAVAQRQAEQQAKAEQREAKRLADEKEQQRRAAYAAEQAAARHKRDQEAAEAARRTQRVMAELQTADQMLKLRHAMANAVIGERSTTEWLDALAQQQASPWLADAMTTNQIPLLSVWDRTGQHLIFNWADPKWGNVVIMAFEAQLRLAEALIFLRRPEFDRFLPLDKLGMKELGAN